MPYHLEHSSGGKATVVTTPTGKKHSNHPLPEAKAKAQMRAMYANMPESEKKASMLTPANLAGQIAFLKRATALPAAATGAALGGAAGLGMGALVGTPVGAALGGLRYGFLSPEDQKKTSLGANLLGGAGIGAATGGIIGAVPAAIGGGILGGGLGHAHDMAVEREAAAKHAAATDEHHQGEEFADPVTGKRVPGSPPSAPEASGANFAGANPTLSQTPQATLAHKIAGMDGDGACSSCGASCPACSSMKAAAMHEDENEREEMDKWKGAWKKTKDGVKSKGDRATFGLDRQKKADVDVAPPMTNTTGAVPSPEVGAAAPVSGAPPASGDIAGSGAPPADAFANTPGLPNRTTPIPPGADGTTTISPEVLQRVQAGIAERGGSPVSAIDPNAPAVDPNAPAVPAPVAPSPAIGPNTPAVAPEPSKINPDTGAPWIPESPEWEPTDRSAAPAAAVAQDAGFNNPKLAGAIAGLRKLAGI